MQFSGFRKMFVGLVLFFTAQAQASLIVNGGFEDNTVKQGHWAYFASSQVNGWEGSNIEIWHHLNKVKAQEGVNHAELNAHGGTGDVWSIFQTFNTTQGMRYEFSFFYRARIANQESFKVTVGDFEQTIKNYNDKSWQQFVGNFKALSDKTTLQFTAINKGTYGNFLDDVVVNAMQMNSSAVAAVPVASTVALFSVGLLTLLGWRRRRV